MSNRGGARSGAGRKSNADIVRARELMDAAISDADWIDGFKALFSAMQSGDARAAQILLAYRFGLPTQKIAGDEDAAPIQIIRIRSNARTDHVRERRTRRKPASGSTQSGRK